LKQIPTIQKDNVLFRADLHEYLAGANKDIRNDFAQMCLAKPQITFKTMFWTFQPKPNIQPYGVLPFITWDWQDEKIQEISDCMISSGKIQAKKSREVGGTWIIIGCGVNLWLFRPRTQGLLVSRKEELVDKKGSPDCLFWKWDYLIQNLPEWTIPSFERTERHSKNLWNDSVTNGEATVENVGRGGRLNWVFCDEFPAVKHSDAICIERALSDTASCKIYLGTSEYRSHPFSKMGTQPGVIKMAFGWWLHPFKAKGLYWSDDINQITIEDIDYYKTLAPDVFKKYTKGQSIKYSDLMTDLFIEYPNLKLSFVADGGKPDRPKWRSPWYDKEEQERSALDVATNLDMNEIGAGDMVFTAATLNQMIALAKKPDFQGEILYKVEDNKITNCRFIQGGKGKLKWWGNLGGARPVQNHNYVLGCDISLGQGQSNSVCSIFDVDLRQKVGSWVDSNTLPQDFADTVYAVGQWVGGMSGTPYLGWEANGIGQVFGKRISILGYGFVYKTTTEKKGRHEKLSTTGWYSNSNTKLELLVSYNASLTATFHPAMKAYKFINYDQDSIREAEDYIFDGNQIVPSQCIEDSGGAKMTHGDRVVADALCCLLAQDQPKSAHKFAANIIGTVEWRKKRAKEQEYQERNKVKLWLNL
jgi:hypothetical protein